MTGYLIQTGDHNSPVLSSKYNEEKKELLFSSNGILNDIFSSKDIEET